MPAFSTTVHRVARKQHRCCECMDIIEPGDVYERVHGCWDGQFLTFKTCLHCETARDDLIQAHKDLEWVGDDGAAFMFQRLEEQLTDAAAEFRSGLGRKFQLLRHLVGMDRRREHGRSVSITQTGGAI